MHAVVCLQGCLIPAHSRCLSPVIPAKLTGGLYHLSCNWGCLSRVFAWFPASQVAVAEFRILTFPCSEQVGGPVNTGSRLDCLHGFQHRGFHSSSSWAQSVHREEAPAPVGPLHPVTWRLSLICSSVFAATFIFRLPCCFLMGPGRDLRQPGPLPPAPRRSPGGSLLQQRRKRRSPRLLNEVNQEVETVRLSLPWP